MVKKRLIEWQNLKEDGWRLKRERPGAHRHVGCLRWETVGGVFREHGNEFGQWRWWVRIESPIDNVGGLAKSAKAAKLAIETALRVLEAKPRRMRPRRKQRPKDGEWVRVKLEPTRPHWAE